MTLPGNFFLVGLMGAGKTTVGRALARLSGKTFYDSDHEIEARCGVRIPHVFEVEGETGFRVRELETIRELSKLSNIILATGGGAVLNAEVRSLLAGRGYVIYLRAPVEELYQRTRHDKNRPLLQTADPRAKLQSLFDARDPLYREVADLVVDSTRQNAAHLAQTVYTELLRRHAACPP